MLKFFRKHNKKLLAIFMALLLVVWLAGDALTALLDPRRGGGAVLGTSRFGEVRYIDGDRMDASMCSIVARVGLNWEQPLGPTGTEPLTVYDWVLLTREAQQLGFEPDPAEAEIYLTRQDFTRPQLNDLASSLDRSPEQVYAAVAEFLAVTQAASIVGQAAQASEAEIRVAARDANEKVTVNLVPISVGPFVDEEAPLNEAELESLFSKYRDQEPGTGMNFGYYLPQRVKAEFIKIGLERIKENLPISETTLEKKARRYWKENRQDRAFRRPLPQPTTQPSAGDAPASEAGERPTPDTATQPTEPGAPASELEQPVTTPAQDPAAGEGPAGQPDPSAVAEPASQPAESPAPAEPTTQAATPASTQPAEPMGPPAPPPSPFFETYEEAHEAALEVIRKREAAEQAGKIADYLIHRTSEPWFDQALGDDNYKKRPDGVEVADYYQTVIADPPPALRCEQTLTTGQTDWFTPDAAREVPSIGAASLRVPGQAGVAFSQLAFQVQGLVELPDNAQVDRSLYLALFQSGPVALQDSAGNLYVYRLVAAQPARAPESLDEVRDRVAADLRKQKAYEEAQRQAETLLEQAKNVGLEAALEQATELQAKLDIGNQVVKPAPFARKKSGSGPLAGVTYIPQVGLVDESFTAACFELGPADEGRQPLKVIPLPDQNMVVVVERTKLEPMSKQTYVSARPTAMSDIQSARYTTSQVEWFDPKLVRARNHWEPTRRQDEEG